MARVALVAGLMAVYALSVSAAVAAPPPADCSNVVTSLLDCLPYVTNGSDTASPSKACCAGVATVVTQSPVCICQSLDEASNLGIALNITRVVGLPVACSVRAPKVHCDGMFVCCKSSRWFSTCCTHTSIARSTTITIRTTAISRSVTASGANYTALATFTAAPNARTSCVSSNSTAKHVS
ncbi:non-specific lipid transfer protein GPI-anchored 4-like [Musa acuminata AAA Group]|uniref:non-specific lipid transfer protein GPI-anchored 4-like n=1 Tax=Musa acuminata AAA Group TaxID=214697 RepID=UPI0031E04850